MLGRTAGRLARQCLHRNGGNSSAPTAIFHANRRFLATEGEKEKKTKSKSKKASEDEERDASSDGLDDTPSLDHKHIDKFMDKIQEIDRYVCLFCLSVMIE
jgi:hypothetical protein